MYFCLQVDGPINGGGGGGGAYNGKFTVCERGTSCQYKVYERGTLSVKNGLWKGKGLDLGGSLPL